MWGVDSIKIISMIIMIWWFFADNSVSRKWLVFAHAFNFFSTIACSIVALLAVYPLRSEFFPYGLHDFGVAYNTSMGLVAIIPAIL